MVSGYKIDNALYTSDTGRRVHCTLYTVHCTFHISYPIIRTQSIHVYQDSKLSYKQEI